jgi:predicted anti-sigma-YlaC factor YlaD
MRCSRIEELLAGHIDGSLGKTEVRLVEDHLESCSACRQAAEEVRLAYDALKALPPLRAPATFAPRVKAAVRAQAAGAHAQLWPHLDLRTLLPSTALALIAVGTLGWFWAGPQDEYVAPTSAARPHGRVPAPRTAGAMVAEDRAVMAPGPVAPAIAMHRVPRGHHGEMAVAGPTKRVRNPGGLVAMPTAPAAKAALGGGSATNVATLVVALTRTAKPPFSATEARLPEPATGSPDALTEYAAALASPEARLGTALVAAVASDAVAPGALRLTASTGGVSLRSLTSEASLDWPST